MWCSRSTSIRSNVFVSHQWKHCCRAPYSTTHTSTPSSRAQRAPRLWQTDGVLRPVPTEDLMRKVLEELFPTELMIFNGRKVHNIQWPNSTQFLEIDVCIPKFKLYLEYQDPHHYTTVWYCHRTLETVNATDNYKKKTLESRGDTIIQVPCWWDGQPDSLAATIKAARPDLLQHLKPSSLPVSTEIPSDLFIRRKVSSIGELMAPSFMSLRTISRNTWWLGEKYDGMRCCWNPETENLYSRAGVIIPFPDALKAQMPSEFIDGEIWGGRGQYMEVAKLNPVFKSISAEWPSFRIVAFDIPSPSCISNKTPFEERYKRLLSIVDSSHPFITVATRAQLQSKDHLEDFTENILQADGEGVILHQMKSLYENGRSQSVGKIKPYRDTEALVISADSERLTLELPDGTRFKAPFPTQEEISGPLPKANDVVTFTFKRFSNGTVPVSPRIQRVRLDLSWDEVVAKSNADLSIEAYLANKNRWSGTREDMRLLFEDYARNNNFDPLNPENWYNVRRANILSIKGAILMLQTYFNGNIVDALLTLFPEIGLDKFKFEIFPRGFWQEQQNIRDYFIKVANENGFDPFVAENWYKFPFHQVKKKNSIENYYSYSTALVKAFPEVKFEEKFQFQSRLSLFEISQPQHEQSSSSHPANGDNARRSSGKREDMRMLFEHYARNNNFDPLNPENWYKARGTSIRSIKGAELVLQTHFNGNIADALQKSFPEIEIDRFKFQTLPRNFWKDQQNIRGFFMNLANEKGFDPFVPENWYKFPFHQVKKIHSIESYYSYSDALVMAFPEVKFTKHILNSLHSSTSKSKQRIT